VIEQIETVDDVVAASPFIYYKAAISSESAGDGIVIRGISPEAEMKTANIAGDIILGEYSFNVSESDDSGASGGMLIGVTLADRLGVSLDDPVVLYSLSGEDLRQTTRPRVAKFYITGIFETGMYEFDAQMAYISLEAAQKLFRLDDEVTGIHLKLTDIFLADMVTPRLQAKLGSGYDIIPWNILHRNLFSWIEFEKKILFIGFILIVLVAAFSIISTLVMLAMEKRTEIGTLKTIGSTRFSIAKIFVYNGLIIGLAGILGGWGLALTAAEIQNRYHFVSMPAELYFISYLPIDVHIFDFLFAGILTIVICFLAALYPALRASGQSVIDVLRQ